VPKELGLSITLPRDETTISNEIFESRAGENDGTDQEANVYIFKQN
jgi:hypothetical protein